MIQYTIKHLLKNCLQKILRSNILLARGNKPGVVITFDDGPHVENTAKIVDILNERSIKGTFFVLGSQLKKYPDLAELIVKHGHELGNHTYDHVDVAKTSLKTFHQSVQKTESIISIYSGIDRIKILRTPFGRVSAKLIAYIIRKRYLLVGWTIDSRDSFIKDPVKLFKYVSNLKLCNGDILLFHEDYDYTVEALPEILDYFIAHKIKFIPLSEFYSK